MTSIPELPNSTPLTQEDLLIFRDVSTGVDRRGPVQEVSDLVSEFVTSEADRAETAAEVSAAAGRVFTNTADGIAATVDGDYFWVVSAQDDETLELWLNDAEVAVDTGKSTVSSEAVRRRTIYVGSVAELEALSLPVGTNVYLTEDGRAGEFVVKAGTPPSDPQKGIYIVLVNGNYAERIEAQYRFVLDWFGADWTGGTLSDDALDAILAIYPTDNTNKIKPPIVGRANGYYRFGVGGKTIPYAASTFLTMEGEGLTTRFVYEGLETNFLEPQGEFVRLKNFRAESTTSSKVFAYHVNGNGLADCDAEFENCLFSGFQYVHDVVGRGSVNKGCLLNGGTFSRVTSPDPFDPGSSDPNIGNTQTGMRRYASYDLEVDSSTAVFEFVNSGPAAKYMNEVTIHGIHGISLTTLVSGGHINYADISLGVLLRSFPVALMECNSIKKLNLTGTTARGYDPLETPDGSTRTQWLLKLDLEAGGSTSDILLDDAVISGVFGNLSEGMVICGGTLGNVSVTSANLPDAFEATLATNAVLFSSVGGVAAGKKVQISSIGITSDAFSPSSFLWSNFTRTASNFDVGSYTVSGFTATNPSIYSDTAIVRIGGTAQTASVDELNYSYKNGVVNLSGYVSVPSPTGTGEVTIDLPVDALANSLSAYSGANGRVTSQSGYSANPLLVTPRGSDLVVRQDIVGITPLTDADISGAFALSFHVSYFGNL